MIFQGHQNRQSLWKLQRKLDSKNNFWNNLILDVILGYARTWLTQTRSCWQCFESTQNMHELSNDWARAKTVLMLNHEIKYLYQCKYWSEGKKGSKNLQKVIDWSKCINLNYLAQFLKLGVFSSVEFPQLFSSLVFKSKEVQILKLRNRLKCVRDMTEN